jgi:hypothetical protein
MATRNLLGDLWLVATTSASGDNSTREVQSPTLQAENTRSGLNWFAWQWPCWRHCFVSEEFLQGENLWSMIRRRQRLCTIFSWRHRYWKRSTSSAVLVVFVLLLQRIDHGIGTLFFVILLTFWLGASVMSSRHCVVADTGYNGYLLDINIYFLPKKCTTLTLAKKRS